MKKILISIISFVMVVLFCSCQVKPSITSSKELININYASYSPQQIELDQQYDIQTLPELEEHCSDILQGVLLDDSQEKIKYSGETPIFGITVTSFKITKVLKGDLKTGDSIKVGEKYFTANNGKEKTLFYYGNYLPSTKNGKYIFFLAKQSEKDDWWSGIYLPFALEKGRYPILDSTLQKASIESLSNEQLNLGKDDTTEYKKLYEEVKEKYLK